MSMLLEQMGRPGLDHASCAYKALRNPALVTDLIAGLQADTARVKYGCAKVLRLVSQRRPELLYPHFDFFARLLDHANRVLQWEAVFVLSHLARVDAKDKSASWGAHPLRVHQTGAPAGLT